MKRTLEQHQKVYNDMIRMVKMHKKPFWIVPNVSDYSLSSFEPDADELPFGTAAVQYRPFDPSSDETHQNGVVIEKTIKSSKPIA